MVPANIQPYLFIHGYCTGPFIDTVDPKGSTPQFVNFARSAKNKENSAQSLEQSISYYLNQKEHSL